MRHSVAIGIIGDFNPEFASHVATNSALQHAAASLNVALSVSWIPTPELDRGSAPARLNPFHGIVCSPGSPYRSMSGALAGITFARERGWPFFGTRGGFQHALVEYARNVLGIRDAEHEESSPDATLLLISRLECAIAGQRRRVKVLPGTAAASAYEADESFEEFRCNFGLNPEYRERIETGGLQVTGRDENGEVRIVELRGHPFFLATLFLPQHSSSPDAPHPLVVAFLKAAAAFGSTNVSAIGAA